MKHASSGVLSQSLVVCLLAVFIIVAVIAMFSTAWVADETDWIGMTIKPLDPETAAALGIPAGTGGVVVDEVEGMARKAGIRHGDVVLGVNGEPVHDLVDFSRFTGRVDISRGGTHLDVIRHGVRVPVLVSPQGHPALPRSPTAPTGIVEAPIAPPGGFVGPGPVIGRSWLGIDAEAFAAGEGRELGIPAGVRGVLIDGVARGGVAERSGLLVNDVIVSVNGQKTDTAAGLWNILAGLDGGDWLEFGVYRAGRLLSITLPAVLGAQVGGFPGRAGGGWGLRQGGTLVCPNCRTRVAGQPGTPCYAVRCPSCATLMSWAQ